MIPQPLHPAVVHFPLVLVVLLPISAIVGIVTIRRGGATVRSWLRVVVLAGMLVGSSWIALLTGGREEEVVERIVPEAAIHDHEERAELFLTLTAIGLVFAAAGLMKSRAGAASRILTVIFAFGLVVAGFRVGHSGGSLVYEHGAASAYAGGVGISSDPERQEHEDRRPGEREDHR